MTNNRLGLSMLLTAGLSAERAGRVEINLKDVEWAIKGAQRIKDLTKIDVLRKQIQERLGKTIDF